MYKNKKVLIYVPTRNSEKTVTKVFARLPNEVVKFTDQILVVDNKSKDNTIKKVKSYKRFNKKLKIIQNKDDKGYGGTQKTGYDYAIKNKFDYVVMLHSDGQYPPEQVKELFDKIIKEKADAAFGSRISGNPLKGNMSYIRFFGNRMLTIMENVILGTRLSEFHSGFRAYRVNALKKIKFKNCTDNYYFDSQILFLLAKKMAKITEITIPTSYGKEAQSPTWKDLFNYSSNIVIELVKYVFRMGIYK